MVINFDIKYPSTLKGSKAKFLLKKLKKYKERLLRYKNSFSHNFDMSVCFKG